MKFNIPGLKKALAAVNDKLAAYTIDANTSAEDLEAVEKLNAEAADLQRKLTAARSAQAAAAATATEPSPLPSNPSTVPAAVATAEEPGIAFARFARSLMVARGNPERAFAFAKSTFGESSPVAMELGAALNTNDPNSGGFMVPERFSNEIIDLLLPATVVRRRVQAAGNVVPLVGGTDNIPTVESGINAYYLGESTDINPSEPTFGNIKMTEREMAAMVPISNKLLRHANRNVDSMIRNLIVRGMALVEDQKFIRGTGTGPEPRGLRFWPNVTSNAANGTVNVANIETDARTAELGLMNNDIPMIAPTWIMAPRTLAYLRDLRDGNGNLYYPSLQGPNPTWRGKPVDHTNSIPINLGGGSNESEVYLVDYAYVMIADSYAVKIDASESASYKVGASMVSAFSQNQTVIRALTGHDFAVTRPKAVSLITAVRWF